MKSIINDLYREWFWKLKQNYLNKEISQYFAEWFDRRVEELKCMPINENIKQIYITTLKLKNKLTQAKEGPTNHIGVCFTSGYETCEWVIEKTYIRNCMV